MVEATVQPADRLCSACFTVYYPVPLPEAHRIGKHQLELGLTELRRDAVAGAAAAVASGGVKDSSGAGVGQDR